MALKEEICITHVLREMKQGRTTPYLCKDDEDRQHIVKGENATIAGLVREWICAVIGTEFGLPIPDFSVAWADTPFQRKRDLFEYNFASCFVENIQDVTPSILKGLNQDLLNDLYMFDYWILNADRNLTEHGGNPNFFVHQKTGYPYVIDHNLAFDSDFDIENHKSLHVCAPYKKWVDLFEIERARYEGMFAKSLEALDNAIKLIPDEWLERYSLDDIELEIKPILKRFESEEFWEAIK
ncbi:HipA family kinase [Vibrio campbellii]|uniref:HipA family kinase n=1 Tax=Vibrio campbellii TaxID=680 RepID=UPI00039F4AA4|nr:HipA family kinase [Vibrio campbellii]